MKFLYGQDYDILNFSEFDLLNSPAVKTGLISGINQFKIVLNTLFHQSIPLLKDSTIFLTGDK